jgi:acetyl esterase/lipase
MLATATILMLWTGPVPLATGDSKWDKPNLTVMLADKPNGAAVVVCPGGGYGFLADDHEGKQVGTYFNKLGVHAFILQYRIVREDRKGPLGTAPLLDAQRAIRLVRSRAKDSKIDTQRIGLMGFSAGGHLASTAGTHFDDGDAKATDVIDRVSCRPDFLILAYAVISMENGTTHSNEKHVTEKTPATFLFHTNEDTAVLPENSIRFYQACKKAKVPVELHIFEKGKHGIGLGTDPKWTGGELSVKNWSDRLTDWLKTRKVIESATP